MTIPIFLSHDIDYSVAGPSCKHIKDRIDRFDSKHLEDWVFTGKSLYYNIPEIMEIERNAGIHSTFFFRPYYEDGQLLGYSNIIPQLESEGWEVGLHINKWENTTKELELLQMLCTKKIEGVRCHFLRMDNKMYPLLKKNGIKYDSSTCFWKREFHYQNLFPFKVDNIAVYPITFADCYGFEYWGLNEDNIINKFKEIIKTASVVDNPLITICWHDTSLKMIGGRMYQKVLEYLLTQDVKIMRGIDVYENAKTS